MATLWERIVGDNLEGSTDPQDAKIAIHGWWAMISEWERGYETQANILNNFNLSASQQADAQVIKQNINAAPQKTDFIRICKDWSYAGEISDAADPNAGKYHDWAQFVTRMNNAVTDQGGTPP